MQVLLMSVINMRGGDLSNLGNLRAREILKRNFRMSRRWMNERIILHSKAGVIKIQCRFHINARRN